jgi:hypothetical protein
VRILWWNTSWQHRARTAEQIAAVLALAELPDVVALSELDAARASLWRRKLREHGYRVVRTAPGLEHHTLRVLLGVRRLEMVPLGRRHFRTMTPRSIASARIDAVPAGPSVDLHAVQIPNGSTYKWAKVDHLEALRKGVERCLPHLQVVVGDFNTPKAETTDQIITWGQKLSGEMDRYPSASDGYPPERPWDAEHWDAGERSVLVGLPKVCGMRDVFLEAHPDKHSEGTWRTRRYDGCTRRPSYELLVASPSISGATRGSATTHRSRRCSSRPATPDNSKLWIVGL